jgi:polyphosphate kinase
MNNMKPCVNSIWYNDNQFYTNIENNVGITDTKELDKVCEPLQQELADVIRSWRLEKKQEVLEYYISNRKEKRRLKERHFNINETLSWKTTN